MKSQKKENYTHSQAKIKTTTTTAATGTRRRPSLYYDGTPVKQRGRGHRERRKGLAADNVKYWTSQQQQMQREEVKNAWGETRTKQTRARGSRTEWKERSWEATRNGVEAKTDNELSI